MTASSAYPEKNLTWKIIHDATTGGYAVGGFCVYNLDGILAVIKAAERCRSPAIIQFFPWTLHFHGPEFIAYAAARAHEASVPISVHLDHCLQPSDVEIALKCAFDSIMVDGSMFDEAENISYVRSVVNKAQTRGITIEAELGRMEGKEDGLPQIELDRVMTDPARAAQFVRETGIHFLAPSFGNVHGPYPHGGAEKYWELDRLDKIRAQIGDIPLVLHGTHPVADRMIGVAIKHGMVKINQNRSVRQSYHDFLASSDGGTDLIKLQEGAVEAYSHDIERFMVQVCRSSNKAQ